MSDDPASRRSRRRFVRRQWARRWLTWKPVLLLSVVVLVVVGALWAVYASSLLAVQGVDVRGATAADAAKVRAAAGITVGEPLVSVDLEAIQRRVQSLATIASADVTREWPHQVLVTVTERVPVAVVEIGGEWRAMDRSGVIFRSYRTPPPSLPRVVTSHGADDTALSEAAKVVSSLPADIASKVDHVEVRTIDQIHLVLHDGRTVLWGSSDASGQKARVLTALLQAAPHATAYDVSVPAQPTTTP